jgi:DNA-binding NarL/FixJ family response regulator
VVEAVSGEEALDAVGDQHPSLVLLDVQLPGLSGYEVCRQLRERFGQRLPIVFVSGARTEAHDRVAGLMIGADDYMIKPFFSDELLARVRRLLMHAGAEARESGRPHTYGGLTEREQQVLRLLAQGLTQDAIGAELYISPKTVATHIQRILSKLEVHSRAEAVSLAYRQGLVSPDTVAHIQLATSR